MNRLVSFAKQKSPLFANGGSNDDKSKVKICNPGSAPIMKALKENPEDDSIENDDIDEFEESKEVEDIKSSNMIKGIIKHKDTTPAVQVVS